MYQFLKKLVTSILPQKFIFENEVTIRSILKPIYSGKDNECNLCQTQLKQFQKLPNGDLLCPICGSLPRTRRLWQILRENHLDNGNVILDFSPSRALYRKLKSIKNIHYFATDFENEFLADYRFDITQIAEESNKFDVIICYHILAHITNDIQAMKELFRVLKPNGTLLVQTPFGSGEIYENSAINSPELREKHFGQRDHVRIYSVDGLCHRLTTVGFYCEKQKLLANDFYGMQENETVIICKKRSAP